MGTNKSVSIHYVSQHIVSRYEERSFNVLRGNGVSRSSPFQVSAGKLALQICARVIIDWTRRPLGKVAGGITRGGSMKGTMFLDRRIDDFLASGNRKAYAILVSRLSVLHKYYNSHLSWRRIWVEALAWFRTSVRKLLTSSTISFFMPSMLSSSSKLKSNVCEST